MQCPDRDAAHRPTPCHTHPPTHRAPRSTRTTRSTITYLAAAATPRLTALPLRAQEPGPAPPSAPASAPPAPSLPTSPTPAPRVLPPSVANGAAPCAATLAEYDAPDGRIVVLRFARACLTSTPAAGADVTGHAPADTAARVSPALEAALAASHAKQAAQSAAQAAKPSRRETVVALITAVAVLLLK